jgi:hypothetical protein
MYVRVCERERERKKEREFGYVCMLTHNATLSIHNHTTLIQGKEKRTC